MIGEAMTGKRHPRFVRNDARPKYLIMDARYVYDEDRAICMDTAETLEEARKAAKAQGDGNCIVDACDNGGLVEVVP